MAPPQQNDAFGCMMMFPQMSKKSAGPPSASATSGLSHQLAS
jgi:hypothetical protein